MADVCSTLDQPGGTVMKLLHVAPSILGHHSASRQLTESIVSSSKKGHSWTQVTYTDLAGEP
jgi:FMN-dependent NADH-azoreductase